MRQRQEADIETKKLRERMKIVEEALRAMRDEAREHVLAIKSSDIVLNRLLGSGSFAEVPQKSSVESKRAVIVGLFYEEPCCDVGPVDFFSRKMTGNGFV